MGSITSLIWVLPVGLSNDGGCHNWYAYRIKFKIQATIKGFFFFIFTAYSNRPCYFIPGYHSMCSYFCLEDPSWNVVHHRNPIYLKRVVLFLLYVIMCLIYASKYVLMQWFVRCPSPLLEIPWGELTVSYLSLYP